MKLFRTIRGRLFLCYTSIIVALVLVMSFFLYHYTADSLAQRASESLIQLAINNNANLDAMIGSMDTTANRIVSSALIKKSFYDEVGDTAQQLQYRRRIIDLLFTVSGSKIDYRINLISTDGRFVEFGRNFDVSALPKSDLLRSSWLSDCLALEGKMYVASFRPYEWEPSEEAVFSVCRAFNRTFGAPYDAVAEVTTDYQRFAQVVGSAVRPETVRAFVYDGEGALIYPRDAEMEAPDYLAHLPPDTASGTFPLGSGADREIAAFSHSPYSGLTMVVSENEHILLTPVKAFRNRLVQLGVIVTALTTFVTFILSRQFTVPIRRIQDSISRLNLSDLRSEEVPDRAATYELTKLSRAYTKMVERLHQSLEETVSARSRETEARMRALQAQMNPHFLYNTITIISIKAEDNEDLEVVAMCECLSEMLRYVTRDTAYQVSLGRELEHLDQYLYLMHCRYPGRVSIELDIPEEMRLLIVPKLVVQPLVENSFQHGFQSGGAWRLRLEGQLTDGGWRLTVFDNGVGFTDEALGRLREGFTMVRGDFRGAPGEHIGLSNIFERLRFRYRDAAVFEVENLPEGGCRVTIGGEREWFLPEETEGEG